MLTCHSGWATVFVCFPVEANPVAQSMNYAIVMFVGVVIIAVVYYHLHGKRVYEGPVVFVRQLEHSNF